MHTVSISQVKRVISELVNRVTYGGERIVLTARGRPKAALVSLADLERLQAQDTASADEVQARRLAVLQKARATREEIAARLGVPLPDSAQDLHDLREERDDRLTRLH
ncbi:MAG: type II toxin-antitoxin system Phd/YefM family antitoxin [Anaerolineae bacterium]|nr:type II toxin-antitoxin system Phd/YefM family antitoxin [Anaerolineae bacterium]